MCNVEAPGPIPARWLYCPRKAAALVAGKFLAFKTPLSHKYNSVLADEFRFTPKMLFMTMKNYKVPFINRILLTNFMFVFHVRCRVQVKLGLWIDLTNTNRFYDKTEIEEAGCKYIKINCRGHGETPSEDQTEYV